jgi:peptidoglycan/xylan/chitin deacetylase (PgdA/CDA1 family)
MSLIVLTFHGVGPVARNIAAGERNCWLEQDHFEAALDLVRGQPHVQLTFDDGNASDAEIVLPALLRRGLRATFFVCSGRLGQGTFLNHAHIQELQTHGMTIGSHGVAHRSWRHLPPNELADELAGSRQVLEAVCGRAINSAACPFGDYDHAVLKALRQAGYRSVYTSDGGAAAESDWPKARTTVTRSTNPDDIRRLIYQGTSVWEQSLIGARKLVKRFR